MLKNQKPTLADLVVLGGKVWTGNPIQPEAQALAVAGGRILAVGKSVEIRRLAGSRTRVLDVKGRRIVPGFIDDHTHFMRGGHTLQTIDLRDATNESEMAERLRRFIASLPRGKWVEGGNWDHQRWPGANLPNKKLLDPVTGDHPAFLSRTDGHMAVANSLALNLAGVTRDTPDPKGGVIVRDPVTREPTGVLKDAAMDLVWRVKPPPTDQERSEEFQAAMREAARLGLTSVQDITTWSDWEIYGRFRDDGQLTVRIYSRFPLSTWEKVRDLRDRQGTGDDWLRVGGLKGFVDGSLGSSTALFFKPFTDDPTNSGTFVSDWYPEGIMRSRVASADRSDLQVSIHAIGDRANAVLLDLFAEVERENGPRDRRFRIEHAQHLRPEDIGRFAQLEVIASVQPYHAIDDGRWAVERIGEERCKTTYAFHALMNAKAKVCFGSDWPVAPLDPLLGIYAAVTRATIDGKNPGGWFPEQRVTIEEAVRSYTSTPAYAAFEEKIKGALEPGKLADFVVLSRDIFGVDPALIRDTSVDYTYVGGRQVFPLKRRK